LTQGTGVPFSPLVAVFPVRKGEGPVRQGSGGKTRRKKARPSSSWGPRPVAGWMREAGTSRERGKGRATRIGIKDVERKGVLAKETKKARKGKGKVGGLGERCPARRGLPLPSGDSRYFVLEEGKFERESLSERRHEGGPRWKSQPFRERRQTLTPWPGKKPPLHP